MSPSGDGPGGAAREHVPGAVVLIARLSPSGALTEALTRAARPAPRRAMLRPGRAGASPTPGSSRAPAGPGTSTNSRS